MAKSVSDHRSKANKGGSNKSGGQHGKSLLKKRRWGNELSMTPKKKKQAIEDDDDEDDDSVDNCDTPNLRRSPRRKGGKVKPDYDNDEEGEEEEEEEEPQQANHDEERIQKDKYRRFCNMLLREAREYFDEVESAAYHKDVTLMGRYGGWDKMTHQELHEAAILLAAKGMHQEKDMKKLSTEIQLLRAKSQDTKTKQNLREVYAWSDKEASLAQAVVHMCKEYLFPRFKFLRGKWYEYDRDKEGGFCKLVMNQLPNLSRCTDAEEIWDRVVVPSIKLKYQTLRNNINSVVRGRYGGTFIPHLVLTHVQSDNLFASLLLSHHVQMIVTARNWIPTNYRRGWKNSLMKGGSILCTTSLQDTCGSYTPMVPFATTWRKILDYASSNSSPQVILPTSSL